MLLLASTSDKIEIVTGSAVAIDVHASYADITTAGAVTPSRKNTAITGATTTDVTGSPSGTDKRNVEVLHARNKDASSSNLVTIRHTDGTTTVELWKGTLLAGESVAYVEKNGFTVFTASGLPKDAGVTVGGMVVARLASDDAKTSTTAAEVAGLSTSCPAGTWRFRYDLIYQAAATTTGFKASVNHSGTVTSFVANLHGVDNLATAASSAADQDALAATGQVYFAYSWRAKSTAGGAISVSVDTANADMFLVIEGITVVTVDGNLQLYWGTEVGASACTVKAGSSLTLIRTS